MSTRKPDTSLIELFDAELEYLPTSQDMRDPGLHPRFRLFVANLLTGYLRFAPQRINALVSAYAQIANADWSEKHARREDLVWARQVYLDSGCITPLIGCVKGTTTVDDVWSWVTKTDEIVAYAWTLHEYGIAPGVVSALDLPAYKSALDVAGITLAQAHDVTLANAGAMLRADLPPGWKPVFISQGMSVDDHRRCQEEYDELGILDAVRDGRAWLAVGGMAFEGATNRIHSIYKMTREHLGEGHIHALGISRFNALVPMIHHGWVNSADSSSPAQEVRYNRGPYRVLGPRPTFFWEACHAVSALYAETVLADALAKAEANGLHHQVEVWPESDREAPATPARGPLQPPVTPVPGPSGTSTRFEVAVPATASLQRDVCERCGQTTDDDHTHAPWVSPETARALVDDQVWPPEALP